MMTLSTTCRPPPVNKGPRTSVSAEAYGKWNQKKEYVPVEVAKTDEAKDRIRTVLTRSFLFSGLDAKELEIVVMAMEEVKMGAGERIIKQVLEFPTAVSNCCASLAI